MTATAWRPPITFRTDVPREVREAVLPHLDRWCHVVPTWCHEIVVGWDGTSEGSAARMRAYMDYRWAELTICAPWLRETPSQRETALVHELVHVLLEPLQNFAADAVALIKEKCPDVHNWAEEQRRHAMESVVQDFTRLLGLRPDVTCCAPSGAHADSTK